MNRLYEVGFVMNPESSEEEITKITEMVTGLVEKSEGNLVKLDPWGRRRLAYPIQKHKEGFYVFVEAELPGHGVADIERRLKLAESVMRFVVIRLDDKLQKANKLTKKWNRIEKLQRRRQESEAAAAESNDNRQNGEGNHADA